MENKEETTSVIDPVYEKFRKSLIRALGSNDFYRFFMESIARADNSIQFSNRKEVKTIDPLWIERIEAALDGFQHVVSLPRQEIRRKNSSSTWLTPKRPARMWSDTWPATHPWWTITTATPET